MRKTDHRDQPGRRGRRATALLLATLTAAPAFGGQKPERAMLWETFVRQKPGTSVVLVLQDGQRVEGRLLEADLGAAEVLETRGLGLSDDEQERVTRDLLKARRAAARQVEAPAPTAPAAAAGVRRVAREDVAAVYVPRGDSALWGAMKVVAFAGAAFIVAVAAIFIVGGTPT